jgi:hypothetical protein
MADDEKTFVVICITCLRWIKRELSSCLWRMSGQHRRAQYPKGIAPYETRPTFGAIRLRHCALRGLKHGCHFLSV